MMQTISRRNFMKGTGAVVLATACSGLLAGCGSKSSSSPYTIQLSDFKISLEKFYPGYDYTTSSTQGFSMSVFIKRIGDRDLKNEHYSGLFSAYIGSEKLSITNGSDKVTLNKKNQTVTATPAFKVTDEQRAAWNAGSDLTLRVTPYDDPIAVFTISADGTIECDVKTKKELDEETKPDTPATEKTA